MWLIVKFLQAADVLFQNIANTIDYIEVILYTGDLLRCSTLYDKVDFKIFFSGSFKFIIEMGDISL